MRVWIGIFAVLFTLVATAADEPASYRSGAAIFVADMARKHGFDKEEVAALLARARYSQAVIDAMRRPYEAKPWHKYRPIFLTAERIHGGVAFWRDHRELLERAQAVYGVPPQIITAIIGVETKYGRHLGKYPVIDALTTLGFSYPERADFFRKELQEFLLLSRDESIDALGVTGSYAGAMGLPQFIASSYRSYAVDFDNDGRRDLWGSAADAIGSVGNYLKRHGWKSGEPAAFAARVEGGRPRNISPAEKRPEKPSIRFSRLRAAGVAVEDGDLSATTPVTLIRLDAPQPEYWLGLENFYVITRYNHSNLYAMAVHQLGREIQEMYQAQDGP